MRFGLDAHVIHKIQVVLSKHPAVEKAVLYGSRAKGNHAPGSDIDLNLQGKEITAAERDRILLELDDLDLPYTIDVTIYSQITHDALRDHIQRVGAVLYQRDDAAKF